MALLILFLAACLAGQLLTPTRASACSCTRSLRPVKIGPLDALRDAHLVFSGYVVPTTPALSQWFGPAHEEIQFVVHRVWKGNIATEQVLRTATDSAACGATSLVGFGQDYLVYAGSGGNMGWDIGLCDRVLVLSQAGSDLAALGPGYAPVPGASFGWGWLLFGVMLLLGVAGALWRRRARAVPE
jgi:hypothetical protein